VRDEFLRLVCPFQEMEQSKTTRMTTTKEAVALRRRGLMLL
jgi:hypothetical protein